MYRYDAYGGMRPGSSTPDRFGLTGEWRDATGLYNLRARAYDPSLGRFVSRDSFGGIAAAPQTANRYAYGLGNPIRYTDPSGHFASAFIRNPGLAASFLLQSIPGVGDAYSLATGVMGYEPIAGIHLSDTERALAVASVLIGPSLGLMGRLADEVPWTRFADEAGQLASTRSTTRYADEAVALRHLDDVRGIRRVDDARGAGSQLRSVARGDLPAFDAAKLSRIESSLAKQGVHIERGTPEVARHLENIGAEASYFADLDRPGILVLPAKPSRIAVIEELIHLGQHRRAGWGPVDAVSSEIAAQRKLLDLAERKGWTPEEVQAIKRALEFWEEQALSDVTLTVLDASHVADRIMISARVDADTDQFETLTDEASGISWRVTGRGSVPPDAHSAGLRLLLIEPRDDGAEPTAGQKLTASWSR